MPALGTSAALRVPLGRTDHWDVDCVMVAGRRSDRGAADELLPLCLARGVAVLVAGVFNSGVLADPRLDGERENR